MNTSKKKRLLSGVKPTGRPHIGNYFGAMRQFVEMQEEYESFFMIADLHSLTTLTDAEKLREHTFGIAADYLAIGIDPEHSVVFQQSHVPAHTELTWIFNNLVTVPYLERAHAYKDVVAHGQTPNVGLFDYPVLMATDILLYDTNVVPVGSDQIQHVEIARDIARKFNSTFGELFVEPEAIVMEETAVVAGIDGQKMSKSYGNHIPLFAEEQKLEEHVMSIVTDSTPKSEPIDTETDTVFSLHKLFSSDDEMEMLREQYASGAIGFKESKELLFKRMNNFLAPFRERRKEIAKDREYVLGVLEKGSGRAREIAGRKMGKARELVGLMLD